MCCECNEATEKKEKNILNHTENYFEIFRNFKLKKKVILKQKLHTSKQTKKKSIKKFMTFIHLQGQLPLVFPRSKLKLSFSNCIVNAQIYCRLKIVAFL